MLTDSNMPKFLTESINEIIQSNILRELSGSSSVNDDVETIQGSSSTTKGDLEDDDDDQDDPGPPHLGDPESKLFASSEDEDEDEDDESSSNLFKNQVKTVVQWFKDLTPCQQIVTTLSLISECSDSDGGGNGPRRHRGLGVKVLLRNHLTKECNEDSRLKQMESDTNSLSFWSKYFQSNLNPDLRQLMDILIETLPFVGAIEDPQNSPFSMLYLHLITSSISSVTSNLSKSSVSSEVLTVTSLLDLERCQELLSLAFVSPAFSSFQKKNTLSPYSAKVVLLSNELKFIQSKLSSKREPMKGSGVPTVLKEAEHITSQEYTPKNLVQSLVPLSSSSLPTPLAPSTSITALTTSTSSGQLQPVKPFSSDGMSTIPSYLKGLRLHKYTPLFANLPSLNHFLNLTDEQLETIGVAAKGARKKFLQNLEKLRDRERRLKELLVRVSDEGSTGTGSNMSEIISTISEVINTPLSKESNEVSFMIHLLIKVKEELLRLEVHRSPELEKSFHDVIVKCLQPQHSVIWSREQIKLLIQLRDSTKLNTRAILPTPLQDDVPVTDRQANAIVMSMTEEALSP